MLRYVLILLTACVASCQTSTKHESTTLGSYNFNYKISNRENVGLVQVFDDKSKTYLQFIPTIEVDPRVSNNETLSPLEIYKEGSYYLVHGVYNHLLVAMYDQVSVVDRIIETPAPKAVLIPKQSKVDNNPELAACQQQLSKLDEKLTKCLNERSITSQPNKEILYFLANRTKLQETAPLKSILDKAETADYIIVTGFTSAKRVTRKSVRIAKTRAIYVKNLLVANGISSAKIQTTSFPYGHFVADNSTFEGRATNRRVEVIFSQEK